jgi:hypothetical protein
MLKILSETGMSEMAGGGVLPVRTIVAKAAKARL